MAQPMRKRVPQKFGKLSDRPIAKRIWGTYVRIVPALGPTARVAREGKAAGRGL